MLPKLIRPYSPSKWYDCWRYRIQNGLSENNKFYDSLRLYQKEQLHKWLSRCLMRSDLLLFDHDNHAIKMEWKLNPNEDIHAGGFNTQSHYSQASSADLSQQPLGSDSVRFVAKHDLPAGTLISTELPIGYVNFKIYHDFIKNRNEMPAEGDADGDTQESHDIYENLMSENSEMGQILQANVDLLDDESLIDPKFLSSLHPKASLFSPKYDKVEGYHYPIWECVDLILQFLYTNTIYYHEHTEPCELFDGVENSDQLIHCIICHTFILRYIHKFPADHHQQQAQQNTANVNVDLSNPMPEISEYPPARLQSKYPHIPPFFMSDLFRIIHLNGYVNQTLYLRHILGHGLYAMSSYFDHSCDPNTVYCTFNGKLRMVTSKAVKQHEPLLTSYLAEFIDQIDVVERRERLNWIGFDCHCYRCRKELSLLAYQKHRQHQHRVLGNNNDHNAQERRIHEGEGGGEHDPNHYYDSMLAQSTTEASADDGSKLPISKKDFSMFPNFDENTSIISDNYMGDDEIFLRKKKKLDEEFLPTIWSELRYLHHVLDEGRFMRWQSKFFRYLSFGNEQRMLGIFMRGRIRNGIVWTARDCFKDIECLYPDAALGDPLIKCAARKFKY